MSLPSTIVAMPSYVYGLLVAGWLIWLVSFILIKQSSATPAKLDRRARWGILLQVVAYSLVWQNRFWLRSPQAWRIGLAIVFFALAVLLAWTGKLALGRQWRIDAGLNADHELVKSGPYRVVRHPIYSSMLCTLLGTGFLLAPLWVLGISLVIFLVGIEIRVRIEDGLLGSHFGEPFQEYRRAVPAYVPFLR